MKLYFKAFQAAILALSIIVVIELSLFFAKDQNELQKNIEKDSILELSYLKNDVGQKYMIGYKNYIFLNSNADFVQVGDSSGFYGVKPKIINSYLKNANYINTNCCADTGFKGYEYSADYFLENNPRAKFLVLHITPYSMPNQYKNGFSQDLFKIYSSPWKFFYKLPSTYYRKYITSLIYRTPDQKISTNFMEDFMGEYAPKNQDYIEFMSDNKGWLPYNKKANNLKTMPTAQCGEHIVENFYDQENNINLIDAFKNMKKIANKYNVKLIILFNPVACHGASSQLEKIINQIEKFKLENSDIYIPFNFITTWDKEKFSDEWHLTPEAAQEHSHELGQAIKKSFY